MVWWRTRIFILLCAPPAPPNDPITESAPTLEVSAALPPPPPPPPPQPGLGTIKKKVMFFFALNSARPKGILHDHDANLFAKKSQECGDEGICKVCFRTSQVAHQAGPYLSSLAWSD